jgi:uncharacterized protein (DUF2132 family)
MKATKWHKTVSILVILIFSFVVKKSSRMTYAYPVSFPLRWKMFPFPNQLFVSSAGAPSISFFYQDVAPNGARHQVIAYLKALAFFLFVNLKKSRMKATKWHKTVSILVILIFSFVVKKSSRMTYAYPVSFPLRWKMSPFPNQLFVSSAGAPSISFFYQDFAPTEQDTKSLPT